jgi:hypothetical protein
MAGGEGSDERLPLASLLNSFIQYHCQKKKKKKNYCTLAV